MPSSSFTVAYGGYTYDLDGDYDPAASKRLFGIVQQLMNDGEKRLAEAKTGNSALSDSVPCPAKKTK